MDEEIRNGDVVWLKSGGPAMTVGFVNDNTASDTMVSCHWFVNGVYQTKVFQIHLLTKTEPRPASETKNP